MNVNFCWLRERSEVDGLESEGGAGGRVVGVIVAMSFGTGKLEHEGLKGRIDSVCNCLFGRGFEPVVECFEMGFDVMNISGGCLSGCG